MAGLRLVLWNQFKLLNVPLREISLVESFTYSIGDLLYCTEHGQC